MANPEHVKVVKQGAKAIEEWRKAHPEEQLDLRDADLSEADLSGADLSNARLHGAELDSACLSTADLSGTDLGSANLRGADLSNTDLLGASLMGASLLGANLSRANLSKANLLGTNLRGANLRGANLRGANLWAAIFVSVNFAGANLAEAVCARTVFADCQIHGALGLPTAKHLAPSSIGVDTLIASFRAAGNRLTPELETFFRGAGVPQELLTALPCILAEVRYCTCFISYGEPDRVFAERLCASLKARGVTCWLYSMDATPGKRTWTEIGQKRREADKMVVLCSSQALIRDGVLKEIEEQEDEDPDKMMPVSLDNLWKKDGFLVVRGKRDLKPPLIDRNFADFSNGKRYGQALDRLLKGLERKQP